MKKKQKSKVLQPSEYAMKLLDLHSKPRNERFTDEELSYIRLHNPRSSMNAKYCLYRKKSSKGLYIGFFIDQSPTTWRRSGVFNHWEVIAERSLAPDEYEEMVQNFGCNTRRFLSYMYKDVEALIAEDLLYGVKTPLDFVKECKKRGYSGCYQTQLQF